VEIRRLEIRNFRGIKELIWKIPSGRRFIALIGPGDSSKSTILTAIDMALSDRWNLSFADTDFYQADLTQPISVRVTLADLPKEVRQHGVLGMHLSGLDANGELHQDPEDDHEACVVISFTVGADLEPKWTVYRPDKQVEEAVVSSATRRLIGAYKVDERIDAHLRWTKTSALGRLTEAKHGTAQLLADANRTARNAVTASIPLELQTLTRSIQDKMHELGGGEFNSLQPGLDQSLSTSSGNLALYEGEVPLTNFGLGSRRLAGVAAQQLAYDGKAFLLVDEVEYGLEPHRLVNLLTQLRRSGLPGQILVTTHSPTALQHLDAIDLAIVRSSADGVVRVISLDGKEAEEAQGVLRSSPEAFLARRAVLGEGKTEYGLLLGLLEQWDSEQAEAGSAVSAALGVVAVEGSGGTGTIASGKILDKLGYEVTVLLDSDVPADNLTADAFDARPLAAVVRWRDGFNIERAVCEVLDAAGLSDLIQLGINLSDHPEDGPTNFLTHLKNGGLPKETEGLDVAQWIASGVELDGARELVAMVASQRKWFKQVHRGKELARRLMTAAHREDSDEFEKLARLRAAIFEPREIATSDEVAEEGRARE
jgi:hypothetical protein